MTTRRSAQSVPERARSIAQPPPILRSRRNCTAEVRAAGRVVLSGRAGKLIFVDIRDWTGKITSLDRQEPGGDRNGSWPSALIWATSSESMAS